MLCIGIRPKGRTTLTDRDTGRLTTLYNAHREARGRVLVRLLRIETDPLAEGDRIVIERADGRRYEIVHAPRTDGHSAGEQIRVGLAVPHQCEVLRDDLKVAVPAGRQP